MVCPPVRSIIRSLKLVDYVSVQADKPYSVSHKTRTINLKNTHNSYSGTFHLSIYGQQLIKRTCRDKIFLCVNLAQSFELS